MASNYVNAQLVLMATKMLFRWTGEQLLDTRIVDRAAVMAASTKSGFNRVAWIMPYFVLVLGLDGYADCAGVAIASAGAASRRRCRSSWRGSSAFPRSSAEGHRNMSIELLTCILITIGALAYVFYLPSKLCGVRKKPA